MATDMRPHQRRNRRDAMARSGRAQQAASEETPATSGAAAPPALDKTLRRFRSGFRRRVVQDVFDELVQAAPGPGHLKVIAGLLVLQATEERHQLLELERVLEKAAKGDQSAKAQAEGLTEMLQEHRRATRHLKSIGDGVLRAVKIQAEIEVGNLPTEMRVTGAAAISAYYATLAAQAAAAKASGATGEDPPEDTEPTRH